MVVTVPCFCKGQSTAPATTCKTPLTAPPELLCAASWKQSTKERDRSTRPREATSSTPNAAESEAAATRDASAAPAASCPTRDGSAWPSTAPTRPTTPRPRSCSPTSDNSWRTTPITLRRRRPTCQHAVKVGAVIRFQKKESSITTFQMVIRRAIRSWPDAKTILLSSINVLR